MEVELTPASSQACYDEIYNIFYIYRKNGKNPVFYFPVHFPNEIFF